MRTNTVKQLLFLLFLFIILDVVFWDVIRNGHSFIFGDAGIQHYPHKAEYTRAIKNGNIILWQPLIGSGYPIHAEGEVGEIYPPNYILFRIFSPVMAFNLSVFLHFALGLFGTYFLLLELGLSIPASFAASLIFGFNAYSVTSIEHLNKIQGIAWMPVIILFLLAALRSNSIGFHLLYSVSLGLMLLVAHPQIGFYIFIMVAFTFFYGIKRISEGSCKSLLKRSLKIFLFTLLGVLIASGQLIPLIELAAESPRSDTVMIDTKGKGSLSLKDFITLFIPGPYLPENPFQLYVGFFPVIFVLLSLFNREYKRETFYFMLFSLLFSLCVLGSNTPIYPLIHKLPGFNLFWLPRRMIFLLSFSLSILAAIGIDGIFKVQRKSAFRWVISCMLIILISLEILVIAQKKFKTAKFVMKKPEIVDFLKRNNDDTRFFLYSIPTVSAVSNEDNSYNYPGRLLSDTNILFDIPAINAYLPLIPKSYLQIYPGAHDLYMGRIKGKNHRPVTCRALDILNVGYILSYFDAYCPYPKIYTTPDGLKVFYNPNSRGKFFLMDEKDLYKLEVDVLKRDKISDIVKNSQDESSDEFPFKDEFINIDIEEIQSEYHYSKIRTFSSEPGILIKSENYYPGWEVKIDGNISDIKRRLGSLMAVNLPAGDHTIEFQFKPFSFTLGYYLSCLALSILSFLIVFSLFKSRSSFFNFKSNEFASD